MIAFTAQIKEIKISLDSVGDKVGRIVLKFWPGDDSMIASLSSFQKPDTNVTVQIDNEKPKNPFETSPQNNHLSPAHTQPLQNPDPQL